MQIPLVDLKIQYQSIKEEIDSAIQAVCKSGAFIKGPVLEDFEKKFANFIGTNYSIGVSSGTDALHLSLLALGIGEGDEVILPANTFIATAYSILYVGARPVFVDVDPQTFNINVNAIESKITKNTKAIIPVHLYGQPAQMDKIMLLAKKYTLAVVEDACQAHGAVYKGKKTGSFGDLAAFSFYPGKNLGAYGDGGAITTNSEDLYKKIIKLREYGSDSKYVHSMLGFNSRLDTIQAAVLKVKLKHLDWWNEQRQKAAEYYTEKLNKEVPEILTPIDLPDSKSVHHLYVIQVDQRNKLARFLETKGIQTGIHYPLPLHLQTALNFLNYKKGDFPITEELSEKILSLPIYPELTLNQQDYIIESIKEFIRGKIK